MMIAASVCNHDPGQDDTSRDYKRTVWVIAGSIFIFAFARGSWAAAVGSSQFLKDAVDWIYTVLLNAIAALVFGRGLEAERISALVIAAIFAVAGAHTLYDLWDKITDPRPIEPGLLGFSATSAIVIGLLTAAALARFRHDPNPLMKATWLSARNDAISTTFSTGASLVLHLAPVRWPEYALDVLAAGLAFQAAVTTARASLRPA